MRKLFILFALVAPLALAQVPKTARWEHPTQRVNGDALTLEEIAGYDIECFNVATDEVIYATGLPTTPNTHVTPEVFTDGNFACRMRTIDTETRLSTWNQSNVFTVGRCEVTDCTPLPPQSIVITLP